MQIKRVFEQINTLLYNNHATDKTQRQQKRAMSRQAHSLYYIPAYIHSYKSCIVLINSALYNTSLCASLIVSKNNSLKNIS